VLRSQRPVRIGRIGRGDQVLDFGTFTLNENGTGPAVIVTLPRTMSHSYRKATVGSIRLARRAGT
jgi:hypothetical protein